MSFLSTGALLGADPISPPPGGKDVLDFDQARLRKPDAEAAGKWVEIDEMPFLKSFRVDLPAGKTVDRDHMKPPQSPPEQGHIEEFLFGQEADRNWQR